MRKERELLLEKYAVNMIVCYVCPVFSLDYVLVL
jgi:hypothetical protein